MVDAESSATSARPTVLAAATAAKRATTKQVAPAKKAAPKKPLAAKKARSPRTSRPTTDEEDGGQEGCDARRGREEGRGTRGRRQGRGRRQRQGAGSRDGVAVAAVEGEEPPEVPEDPEGESFTISDDDEEDAPAQQVATAGATADPVKDYLKQIGKVALLNAEQEVELAKRIEAGLFAEEKLNSGDKIDAEAQDASSTGSPRTASGPRTTCSRPTCASSSRWPSATPVAACCSWT